NMFGITGPDSGFDSVGEQLSAKKLNALLDHLEQNQALSDTIIYPNNGNDHLMVQATAGNFTNSSHKVQLGAAWWFNDTKEGMEQHLVDYANVGLLSKFVGMLTDSRSMISYTRHEYFRRILCNFLGDKIEKDEIQLSDDTITKILKDICYNNAVNLFKIEERLPVREEIKLGTEKRDELIENYKTSLINLAENGIKTVTYNFMPVFDWTRSQLDYELPDGSNTLIYNHDQIKDIDPLTTN